jgi:hypothetical protein
MRRSTELNDRRFSGKADGAINAAIRRCTNTEGVNAAMGGTAG